jgi:hypothetical protein
MVKSQSQGINFQPAYNKTNKVDRIVHILRMNCPFKTLFEGNVEGKNEDTGGRGIKRRQLLDDHNENRR